MESSHCTSMAGHGEDHSALLSKHHQLGPSLNVRGANNIIAFPQGFQEHSSPSLLLLRDIFNGKEKGRGEGDNWDMGEGLVELEPARSSLTVA